MTKSSLPPGTMLAGHTVVHVLGQGGFGITYLARSADGHDKAIKEFFPVDDAERIDGVRVAAWSGREKRFEMGRAAFLDEARTLNTLPQKPGLVRIEGAFEKFGTVYALMEFIDGETLDKAAEIVLRKRSHIPVMLLSDLLDALLNALDTVHRVGVLHRDIKPANIMIRRTGQPVLIDFGAARPITRGSSAVSMFSRRYAALEQFPARATQYKARREHGPEVDIFATSIMLYELVSRSLPPDAEERFKTLRQKGADPYLPVRQNMQRNRIAADYPDALLDAIDAGCALFPEDRLQSARDMALRMEGFLRAKLEAPAEPPLKPLPAKGGQSRRKKPALRGPVLIGLIILLLATAGVLYGIFGL